MKPTTMRCHAQAIARRQDASQWRQHMLVLGTVGVTLLASIGFAHAETTTASAFTFFGTPKYGPDFEHLDYVNPDAPKGGEISIWRQGTFDTFNPFTRKGTPAAMSSVGIEDLMTGTADEISTSYCLVCETLEYPEDQSWVIFSLRPEARFADGSPITAEDVVFTYELFMEQGLPSFREGVARVIAGAEALDEAHVKFTFVEGSPVRDRIGQAGALPVMSKAWFEETGLRLDDSMDTPILGSGPYMLDSYETNERIVYRRNPDYWGNDLPINIGRNNFDTIRIEFFGDSDAAFEGFKAGAYTFRLENSSKSWAEGYDFEAINSGAAVKVELPDGTMASGQAFVFNLRRDKFQDPRVRDAIGRMFNFEWSNETLFYGLYERINGFATNSYNEAKGVPSAAELALLEPIANLLPEGELTDEVYSPPISSTRQLDRAQLREASALLDEAGWIVGDDGLRRNADGEVLSVEFLEYSPAFDRVINPFIENLTRLGVEAKLNRVDWAQYVERSQTFDYDIITDHLSIGYEAGGGLSQRYGSLDAANSVFNSAGLADPAVDALIDIARNAETEEDMIVAMQALDRTMRALKFTIPQWYKNVHTVAYYDIFEHPETLPPYALGELDFWWFNAEKYEALKASGALR